MRKQTKYFYIFFFTKRQYLMYFLYYMTDIQMYFSFLVQKIFSVNNKTKIFVSQNYCISYEEIVWNVSIEGFVLSQEKC